MTKGKTHLSVQTEISAFDNRHQARSVLPLPFSIGAHRIGTSSIVTPTYPFPLHLQLLSSIVETTVKLRELGHRVVIVSSGAIGVGMKHMRLKERGKGLHRKQALAAIGQGKLITLWDQLFSQLDQPIAQILLTRQDISDVSRGLAYMMR
jgi:glutamate 5-kinase